MFFVNRIRASWDGLRSSYWFVPAAMTLAAGALAMLTVWMDEAIDVGGNGWFYTGSADGARQLLAAVAGSMVTVAGVAFSVNVVALSLASSQFGPRLLRNFMRDRGNQVVLGTFIATFVYCLLVLRTVRGAEGSIFVPQISVSVAIVLSLASVGVLIFFIHHSAVSMQAPVIIANVSRELQASIEHLFPEELGDSPDWHPPEEPLPDDFERDSQPVPAARDGYVQLVDENGLLRLAEEHGAVMRIVHRPGHFVMQGEPLAMVWPGSKCNDLGDGIRETFVIGSQQTPLQDVEFTVDQLVEVAVRALSPGINDPFTAIACLDRLGAALRSLANRRIPSPFRHGGDGRLRVVAYPLTFDDVADAAFRQIRQYGRNSPAVLARLLEVIDAVAAQTRRGEDLDALAQNAALVQEAAAHLPQESDRNDIEDRYRAACKTLQSRRG